MTGCAAAYRAELDHVAGKIEDVGGHVLKGAAILLPDLEPSHESYLKMLNIAMAGGLACT